LPANTFTRANHVFIGWTQSNTPPVEVQYKDRERVSLTPLTDQITLYAVWAFTYTVSYERNNGSGTMAPTEFTAGVTQALRANTFTRPYYTFAGWARTSGGTAQYADQANITSNLTNTPGATVPLYAVWTGIPYTVAYNANGGSGTMAPTGFNYGTSQNLRPNTFGRTADPFAGRAQSTTATTAQYENQQSVSDLATTSGATVTLYAVWTPITYTVRYNANNGNGSMANSSFTYDQPGDLPFNTEDNNGISRYNYSFRGWARSQTAATAEFANGQSVINLAETQGAIVTLYAVWAPIYRVVYNANGGGGAGMPNSNFIYGVEGNLTANTFTRTGYVFAGWATFENGPVVYSDRQSVISLSNEPGGIVNLYAVWGIGFSDSP
jgi:uncharacterized repeat protein (TIGR02543 family)